MKKIIPVLMLILLAAFISISCKTTPTPDPLREEKPGEPVERIQRPDQKLIDEAKAKTDATKKRAIDFETQAYYPSEWDALEARYKAAGEMPLNDKDDSHKVAAEYNAISAAYDELLKKTVPLYAQAREDEILAAREKLVSTGFTEYFPEYLEKADNKTLAALDLYESGDYYTARGAAADALNEYETLLLGADVFLARQEIIERNFLKYDEENFSKADQTANAAAKEYDAGNKEKAIENAQEALLRYNLVLSNGWTAYSAERKAAADAERELALAERANIASRDNFREAESFYNHAEEFSASGNHNAAAIQFTEAEAMYVIARKDTEERRQRAEAAIKRAEEKIEESGDTASEAERIIEGGSR